VSGRLGLSRQSHYRQKQKRQRQKVDGDLVAELVRQERKLQPQLGTRKLQVLLQGALARAGVKMGRDRLFEELGKRDLLVKRRRSEYPKTTHSRHNLPLFKNLIRELKVKKPNQVWVGDITYLRTEEDFVYLALLTDKASRKIVGYHCGDTLEAIGCMRALEMALESLPEGEKPIHHSDRGCQYCCHEYVGMVRERGLTISMTETNHTAENAMAERMNGILKGEYWLDVMFRTKAEAIQAVEQAVYLYNTRRPHTKLGNRFPEVVHSLAE
jgi:putative transposase